MLRRYDFCVLMSGTFHGGLMNRCTRVVVALAVFCGCSAELKTTVAVTTVGEPTGMAATQMVGASGGTLRSADGKLELIVPAGALAADTALTVTPISVTAPGGVKAWRLGPEGTTFSKPASVKISFTDSDVGGSTSASLKVAFQDSQKRWQAINASTIDSNSITVATTHLSDWSMLLGWQLRPATANVVPNGTLSLSVRYCNTVKMDEGTEFELVSLVAECQDDEGLAPILGSWAVNGITNGSDELGTVAPGSPTATYTAPSEAPSSPTVAVSVELNPPQVGKVLLVSNVTIGDSLPARYTGQITYRRKIGGAGTSILPHEVRFTAQVSMIKDGDGTYDFVDGPATLNSVSKENGITNCTCSARDFVGMLSSGTGTMTLDAAAGKVTNLQFAANFTVPLTCTGSTDPACSTETDVPLIAFVTSGMNAACTGSTMLSFSDPKTITGHWSMTCPANPQLVGREEEATWALTGAQ